MKVSLLLFIALPAAAAGADHGPVAAFSGADHGPVLAVGEEGCHSFMSDAAAAMALLPGLPLPAFMSGIPALDSRPRASALQAPRPGTLARSLKPGARAPAAPCSAVQPAADRWLAKDKADHLIVSAFLAGAGYYLAREEMGQSRDSAANLAVAFSLTAGLGKEIRDELRRSGGASFKDLAADAAGVILGVLMLKASALY